LLLAQHLGDPDGALRALARSLESVPTFLPALEALGRLAGARGQWQLLLDTLLREIEVTSEPSRKTARLYKAAEILDRHLPGQDARAIELYERALDGVPGYLPAVSAP